MPEDLRTLEQKFPPENHDNTAHSETYAVDGDEQPPENHAADHSAGGADELDATGLSVGDSTTDSHADRHEKGGPDEIEASDLDGSKGDSEQVLTTDGSTLSWEDADGGPTDEEVAEIASAHARFESW